MTIKRVKNPDQLILEKDLLVSGKYRQRKEKSRKHYDRSKEHKKLIEELEDVYKHDSL